MSLQLISKPETAPTLVAAMNPYSCMSEAQVVLACQRKDEKAFREIFKRYQRFVRNDVNKLAPDLARIHDDLVQDVFLRVWRSIGTLKNPNAFKSWLHRLLINLFYDELRRRPGIPCVSLDEPVSSEDEDGALRQIADTRAQPDQLAELKEIREQVNAAISTLSTEFRKAIILRDVQGMPYDEIANITGSELGTVKSRISRARIKVQHHLEHLTCA